jgi:hypothetical protein
MVKLYLRQPTIYNEGIFNQLYWEESHLENMKTKQRREYSKQIIEFLVGLKKESDFYPKELFKDIISIAEPRDQEEGQTIRGVSKQSDAPINNELSIEQSRFLEDMAPVKKRSHDSDLDEESEKEGRIIFINKIT